MSEETWLTYEEAGRALGVSTVAARSLARRHHWPRRIPNEYGAQTRVLVPADRLRSGIGRGNDRPDDLLVIAYDPRLIPDRSEVDRGFVPQPDIPDDRNVDQPIGLLIALNSMQQIIDMLRLELVTAKARTDELQAALDAKDSEHRQIQAALDAKEIEHRKIQAQFIEELGEQRRVTALLAEKLTARRRWWPWRLRP
jgi:hypothetical protein